MCGRFTLTTSTEQLCNVAGVEELPLFEARYNIAPTQPILAVRETLSDRNEIERQGALLRWGLVPSWAKDLSIGNRLLNARSETVHEKPAFRRAFASRRCLILANGFYEWKKVGKTKQPYAFQMQDESPFAFAGLWEKWQNEEGEEIESATILTTTANGLMAPIHERMPVIIPRDSYSEWLDPSRLARKDLEIFLRPHPSEDLKCFAVSTYVSNARHEGPKCLEPEPSLFDQSA